MKNFLIVGGAGYIGSHTIVELLKNNDYDVFVLDNFSNSNPEILQRLNQITNRQVKIYHRDAREQFDDILKSHKIDGVIHFAAFKSVNESVNNPLSYYDNNINSLLNVLDCCKANNIKNIVFSSSCSLYGNVEKLPVDEQTHISNPESPYAYTKLVGERILSDFCKANKDTNAISLRYFNPVGAHSSGLIGESPLQKPNNILPVICESVKNNTTMTVFGNDYNTPDGTCIRDYVHISDIANAHVLALEYLMSEKSQSNYEVFNLGSESGVSVLQLIKSFEEVNGLKVNYKIGPRRTGDIEKIYSDSSKAKKLLNWSIKNDIKDMVRTAWNWSKNKI